MQLVWTQCPLKGQGRSLRAELLITVTWLLGDSIHSNKGVTTNVPSTTLWCTVTTQKLQQGMLLISMPVCLAASSCHGGIKYMKVRMHKAYS